MNKKLLFFIVILFPLFAMAGHHGHGNHSEQVNSDNMPDREKWFKEAREYKHQYLIKELDLTKTQQREFFPLYDQMDDEMIKIQQETRQMEKRIKSLGDKASDLDYEKATDALYEAKEKEANIEKKYLTEFRKVLTPEQLFKLKGAERKFMRELMDRSSQLRGPNHQKGKKK